MVEQEKVVKKGISGYVATVGAAAMLLFGGAAYAQQFIYGNSASGTPQNLYKIDAATGVVVKTCTMNKGNGRGIVVVGTDVFYTVAGSGNIFKTDINTCADMGVAFAVPGATSLSTIAYDGTNFWVGDYAGTNRAFYVSPTGTLLTTITLASCGGSCDGLEFFKDGSGNSRLISNRGDAPNTGYDVYSTSGGAPLTAQFIAPTTFSTTGIAFDGTNFVVSDIFNQKLQFYSGATGAFVKTVTITGMVAGDNQLEDLSADYAQVLGPPPGPIIVPTLSEWTLIALSLMLAAFGLLAAYRMRR
jgi:hypothetical protein